MNEGFWMHKSLSGGVKGQSLELLVGLRGALEELSGPRSGKHCHLRAPERAQQPKNKREEAAGRQQGGSKDFARMPPQIPRPVREETCSGQGVPGEIFLL